jgi:capsular polysaccharide biosynthesis protein
MSDRPEPRSPEYYQSLMARKKLCFLLPVGLGVVSALIALLLPKTYSATCVVTATAIEYGSDRVGMTRLEPGDLLSFYRDPAVAEDVLDQLGLGGQDGLSPAELLESRVSVSTPRKSSLLEITAEMPTPSEAVALADAIAEKGSARYTSQMRAQYDDLLRKQEAAWKAAQTEYLRVEEQLSEFEAQAGIETLRAQAAVQLVHRTQLDTRLAEIRLELDVLGAKLALYEGELSDGKAAEEFRSTLTRNADLAQATKELHRIEDEVLASRLELRVEELKEQITTALAMRAERIRKRVNLEVDLVANRKKLEELTRSLEDSPGTIRLSRRLVDSPALQQALSERSGEAMEGLAGLDLSVTVLNPTHSMLEASLEEAKTRESRVLAELAELRKLDAEAQKELPDLGKQLTAAQQELRPKSHQRELARANFGATTQAVTEAQSVLQSVYLPMARRLVDAQSRCRILESEQRVVSSSKEVCESRIEELQAALALSESGLRRLVFARDQARSAAGSASSALQEARNVPVWPPQQLTITPASSPGRPSSPKVGLIALLTLLGSCLVTWTAAIAMDGRDRR